MSTPDNYSSIASKWNPSKIVGGLLTSQYEGTGYFSELNRTVSSLRDKHGNIGGIMGWTYFNSELGGEEKPWKWAEIMTRILYLNGVCGF